MIIFFRNEVMKKYFLIYFFGAESIHKYTYLTKKNKRELWIPKLDNFSFHHHPDQCKEEKATGNLVHSIIFIKEGFCVYYYFIDDGKGVRCFGT